MSGEVVLRRIQMGVESTRGTVVAATRKVYGTMAVTRAQTRKFPVEDRGLFADKPRAGYLELVDAGFTLNADATFEDLPFYLSLFYNGGITHDTGSATLGYSWSTGPDETSDTLSTATVEAGDNAVAWQGGFGTVDQADFVWAEDDALKCNMTGWVADWIAQSADPTLLTSFAGFTGGLTEHSVESVSGWQSRLFLDVAGAPIGQTWLKGRFRGAAWSVHNQNARKYFGDGSPIFSALGRGRRQTQCEITFEGSDTAQYATYNPGQSAGTLEQVLRIGMYGSAIGASIGTTTASPIAPGTITSIPCVSLANAIRAGAGIYVGGILFVVTSAGAAASATAIPVISQVLGSTIPLSSAITAAKTMNFDFWGDWETFVIDQIETNTVFKLTLQAVYDTTQSKESNIQVINGNSTL